MNAIPLPAGRPTPAQVQSRLEAAHLALEDVQHIVHASLILAQVHVQRLMTGKTSPDTVKRALQDFRDAIVAMEHPAAEVLEMLVQAQFWADSVSASVLGVTLEDQATPADVSLWIDEPIGGYGSGVN